MRQKYCANRKIGEILGIVSFMESAQCEAVERRGLEERHINFQPRALSRSQIYAGRAESFASGVLSPDWRRRTRDFISFRVTQGMDRVRARFCDGDLRENPIQAETFLLRQIRVGKSIIKVAFLFLS
jgi:hypothetical protein